MTAIHDYKESSARGRTGEELVLAHIRKRFASVRPATREEQFEGVDFVAVRPDGIELRLEVKTDERCQRTHNVCVETWSNEEAGRRGWAYTSKADFILYYVPGLSEELLYCMRPEVLHQNLPAWERAADQGRLRRVRVPNRRRGGGLYHTVNILLPQVAFEALADAVECL